MDKITLRLFGRSDDFMGNYLTLMTFERVVFCPCSMASVEDVRIRELPVSSER